MVCCFVRGRLYIASTEPFKYCVPGIIESVVIDALADRLLRLERLQDLLAALLDDSAAGVRERQAELKALRAERIRIEGAIQNMFDFIEQGIVSPRDADLTARLATSAPAAPI